MEHSSIEHQLISIPRLTHPCHKSIIHSVRWSPDGAMLASGGKDKVMMIHRVEEAKLSSHILSTNNGHSNDIDQICWNPKDSTQLASASIDRHAKVWDVRRPDSLVADIKLKNENINICWSNDGSTIAVADKSDIVSFIDTRAGYKVMKDQRHQFEVGEISWNKENDLFFITSGEGNIHVLSYPDIQTLLVIDAFASPCICMRFDPTGKYFAVGSHDALSTIWDAENLACIQAIDRLDWPIKTVSFSHDSRYLASGSEDSFIDIADISSGAKIVSIDVSAPTLTLDFHPKEYILAYTLDDREYRDIGTIKLVGFPESRRRSYN